MNKKLSGAKTVLVPIDRYGKNYIPFVEDLKDRKIKYIDIVYTKNLPNTDKEGISLFGSYITLADKTGNAYVVNNMPCMRFMYQYTCGIRQEVNSVLSLQNSYITYNADSDGADPKLGGYALLVFWYDLPEFSSRNKTDIVTVDYLTIPITTVKGNILSKEERFTGKRFRYIWNNDGSVTPDYTKIVDPDNLFITLQKGSYKVLEDVPLILFNQIRMWDKMEFANIVFDMQNSYITVGGAGSVAVPEGSVYLNVAYERA